LISPFQPTVVLGFSKYTRMQSSTSSATRSAAALSLPAYSSAAPGSWIEHGPTMARRRESSPRRIRSIWLRASATKRALLGGQGCRACSSAGAMSGSICVTRRFWV
jgi:hypothetical protein